MVGKIDGGFSEAGLIVFEVGDVETRVKEVLRSLKLFIKSS